MFGWSSHRFRWEAERKNFSKFTCLGDGTHFCQHSVVVERALSSIDRITRELASGRCTKPSSVRHLLGVEGALRPHQAKIKVNRGNGHSAVVRHSWNSAAKRCFAFTAMSRYCLRRQQSGVAKSFSASKRRKCSEGSSCRDCTMCKRSQGQPLAASTNLTFQYAAMSPMRDVINVRILARSRLGAITQTGPQDSASSIFS